MKNKLGFIFNAHLPFVRHPEYPRFLEEDWLFEAMNESYIPLLRMMFKLRSENVPFSLTFSLSPTLCNMVSDTVLKEKFIKYMELHLELGEKEIQRLSDSPEYQTLAQLYTQRIRENLEFFTEKCKQDLLSAFNDLELSGNLELITTCATHAFLPLYKEFPVAVNAQIETGVYQHAKRFDHQSRGFWFPECGYYPGLEDMLKRQNVNWFSLGSQAFILSEDRPLYGNYEPVKCPNGVYAFARDFFLTSLVWSAQDGYPCDSDYREFYRDIGYDLPMDYIRPYIHEPGTRVFTGFKYWAITGQTSDKNVYEPQKAINKTLEHAKNFLYQVKRRGEKAYPEIKQDPYFTLSFDAELFGHWWFEGVSWLENVIRLAAKEPSVEFMTPSALISKNPEVQTLRPAFSSWGTGGYSQVWLDNSSNAWVLRHSHKAIERMQELAVRFANQKSLKQRFLNQAGRETLLLMASDWPFIIYNHTSEEYATKRLTCHIQNLNLVYDNMCKNAVNTEWLVKAEKRDNIFKDFDYNIFNPKHLKEQSPLIDMRYGN